jgi:DNA-binding LacI/PurR family transcriptional regulator
MQRIPQRLTLVHQVEGILRDGIRGGQWTSFLPGEMELCQRLHVSRTTLRAALATLTREKWLRSARGQTRQIVKRSAPRAEAGGSGRILLLTGVPVDLLGGTPMFLLDELRQELAQAGFDPAVSAGRIWLAQRPEPALERLMRSCNPVACVLFSVTAAIQHWFMVRGLPCLVVGSCHPGVTLPNVEVDFQALGQHAAQQMISRGHRRIAVVVPALGMAGELKMVSGVLAVTNEVDGVAVRVVEHDGSPAMLRRRIEGLLQSKPPTALLVAGAPYVVTVMTVLGRAGIRVPEEMSVISRDHEPYLDYLVPEPTRYRVPPVQFSRRLLRAMLALAQGGSVPLRSRLILPQFTLGRTLANVS